MRVSVRKCMNNLKYLRIYIFEYIKFGRLQAFHLSLVTELLKDIHKIKK